MLPVWKNCVAQLKGRISAADLDEQVMVLHPVHQDNTFRLLAPNRYILEYVKKNLLSVIEEILIAANVDIELVRVEIGEHGSTDSIKNSSASYSSPRLGAGNTLAPEYTFEKHIEGNSNQLARAVALQVGKSPGGANSNNPLFIYGGVGLGKTHLMQATGHLIRKTVPNTKVLYVRSEKFVNDMVNSLMNNNMLNFKDYYRSHHALLIDDIHFFAKKTQSQEEFFHTFSTLIEMQQQIIVTSDSIPKGILDLDERLISRLSSGFSVEIEPPELETRVAILLKKAQDRNTKLSEEVAFFIASTICSNVRELEGALNIVLAKSHFTGHPIDLDLVREALQNLLMDQKNRLSVENIKRIVAEYFKMRENQLLSKNRTVDIARPRQLAMYLTKEYTDLSLPKIGSHFGGRDHTTVLHACKRVKQLMQTNTKVKEDLSNLQRNLGV